MPGKRGQILENPLLQLRRGTDFRYCRERFDPLFPEHFPSRVAGLGHAVSEENDTVARRKRDLALLEVVVPKEAGKCGPPLGETDDRAVCADEDRGVVSRVAP